LGLAAIIGGVAVALNASENVHRERAIAALQQ
jgi:hypothetical protein